MKRAKSYNIDAFTLNIGTDANANEQLGYAYESAANNVFISFDFNWFSTGSAATVGATIGKFASLPGQLLVDGKAFTSSFIGDGLDVAAMRAAAEPMSFSFSRYDRSVCNRYTSSNHHKFYTKPITTAAPIVTPTTASPPAVTTSPSGSGVCIKGTGPGNYEGLCNFACNFGYCPVVCTCTGTGSQMTSPANTGTVCVPAAGLESVSYSGLCSFAYDHGSQPAGACTVV